MLSLRAEDQDVVAGWEDFRGRGCPIPRAPRGEPSSFSMLAELPPILRTLLMTDGTVTRSLEAYFWEPVGIEQVGLEAELATKRLPSIEADIGDRLLYREVRLVGQSSREVYASAYSVVRLDLVPQSMRQKLEVGGVGIGFLIRQSGIETFREILDVGTSGDLLFDPWREPPTGEASVVYRTYRIFLEKCPAILVTEKFPLEQFRQAG